MKQELLCSEQNIDPANISCSVLSWSATASQAVDPVIEKDIVA